jgi:hypothetical protein
MQFDFPGDVKVSTDYSLRILDAASLLSVTMKKDPNNANTWTTCRLDGDSTVEIRQRQR